MSLTPGSGEPTHPLALAAKKLRSDGQMSAPWVMPLNQPPFRTFTSLPEWLDALVALDLDPALRVPQVVRDKYLRALKVYLAAWVDADILVIAEAAAYGALELAVRDQYCHKVRALEREREIEARKRKAEPKPQATSKPAVEKAAPQFSDEPQPPALSALLDYIVRHDGLTDADLKTACPYPGNTAVDRLRNYKLKDPKATRPSIAELRHRVSHGDPRATLPYAGSLQLIHDIIHYAYRQRP